MTQAKKRIITKQTKKEIALKYIKKFPNSPKRAIARKLFDENKLLFGSFKLADLAVRYATGTLGKRNRKFAAIKIKTFETIDTLDANLT